MAAETDSVPADTASPPISSPGVQIDPNALNVGGKAAGLEVVFRKMTPAPESPTAVTGSVSFKGELQLAGSYRAHFDYPEVKQPCFWVDAQEWNKLPRVKGDTRVIWFCFTNAADAIKQLGALGTQTRATIVIDDYTTNVERSDVWDTARLLRVVSKNSMP